MSKTLDKIRKFNESRPRPGSRSSTKGLFLSFEDGDNILRLVGEFIEVKTHYIAPNKRRGDRGLCMDEVFKGDDRMPPVINCADWDMDSESPKKEKTCAICKLHKVAQKALNEDGGRMSKEEKEFFDNLVRSTNPRTLLKWNVIDRRDPYVIEQTDSGERKILGFKIASIGMEAWNDISSIFTQLDLDISDRERGVDVNVVKGNNGVRVTYSANAVLDGLSVKQTPLSDDESELELHDLKRICGRLTSPEKVMEALHADLRDTIDKTDESEVETDDESEAETDDEDSMSKPEASEKTSTVAAVEEDEEEGEEEDEEEDEEEKPKSSKGSDDDKVDPSGWECFGDYEPGHPECLDCEVRERCAKKAGVTLDEKKSKKGKK